MRRAVGALRTTEARFRAIFDHSAAGIALLDSAGDDPSRRTKRATILGYEGDAIRGRPAATFLPAEDAEMARLMKTEVADGTRASATNEYRFVRRDGQLSWGTLTVSRAAAGGATRLIAIVQDVTDRKRLEAQLAHQAYHDPLTELANRSLFRDRVEHALARAARQCERVRCCFSISTISKRQRQPRARRRRSAAQASLRACSTPRAVRHGRAVGGDEFAVTWKTSARTRRRRCSRTA